MFGIDGGGRRGSRGDAVGAGGVGGGVSLGGAGDTGEKIGEDTR
jgi:hypothetical protein